MTSVDALYNPPGATSGRPARVGECVLCGWAPATPIRLRRVTGMVLFWRTGVVSAPGLCRLCADKVFHDVQSHNLTAGWWGIIAPVIKRPPGKHESGRHYGHQWVDSNKTP